jgi:hypothetical protein
MLLLCKIGRLAGTIVDYPYLIGEALIANGRAVRLEDEEVMPILQPETVKKVVKIKRKTRKAKK